MAFDFDRAEKLAVQVASMSTVLECYCLNHQDNIEIGNLTSGIEYIRYYSDILSALLIEYNA